MKKKIIGLSTLLLVLLLGLSSISYASGYKLSRTDTDKIGSTYNYNDTRKNSFWYAVNTAQNEYDTIVVNCYNANYKTWKVYGFNASDVTSISNVENINYMSAHINGPYVFFNSSNDGYIRNDYNIGDASFGSGSQKRSAYMFISNDFYTYENAPWENILLVGPFKIPLTFIPKITDTYADVWTYEDVPFYNASGEDLYLGQLLVPNTYQGYKTSTIFYWQYGDWQFKALTDYASYSVYVGSENGSSIYDIYLLKDYINDNMLYDITFTDTTTQPLYTLAKCVFYIKNNYTIITNGVLDTSNTFSGDYKDKYDDDLQNQQDVDNISQAINDTINQPVDVSGELAQYFSGDMYDIAQSFGFDSTVSIYFTFIEDFLKNVCNVLLDDNDVYFDYSMHGENATRIYASDINLPNGHPLKVFISIVLVFLTVYLLYFQFMKLFEYLQTADLSKAIKSQDVSFYIFKM